MSCRPKSCQTYVIFMHYIMLFPPVIVLRIVTFVSEKNFSIRGEKKSTHLLFFTNTIVFFSVLYAIVLHNVWYIHTSHFSFTLLTSVFSFCVLFHILSCRPKSCQKYVIFMHYVISSCNSSSYCDFRIRKNICCSLRIQLCSFLYCMQLFFIMCDTFTLLISVLHFSFQ